MATKTDNDAVSAYVQGWRQDDNGDRWRPGTEHDACTLHSKLDEDDDLEFGYVLASNPTDALRIDRETFGAPKRRAQL